MQTHLTESRAQNLYSLIYLRATGCSQGIPETSGLLTKLHPTPDSKM